MSIQADIITYLNTKTAITAITTKIAVGFVPDVSAAPYIAIFRDDQTTDDALEGAVALTTTSFVLECVGTTNSGSLALGDAVKGAIHMDAGTFGATTAKGIFVESVSDDYVFRNQAAAQGDLVYALNVEVIY